MLEPRDAGLITHLLIISLGPGYSEDRSPRPLPCNPCIEVVQLAAFTTAMC